MSERGFGKQKRFTDRLSGSLEGQGPGGLKIVDTDLVEPVLGRPLLFTGIRRGIRRMRAGSEIRPNERRVMNSLAHPPLQELGIRRTDRVRRCKPGRRTPSFRLPVRDVDVWQAGSDELTGLRAVHIRTQGVDVSGRHDLLVHELDDEERLLQRPNEEVIVRRDLCLISIQREKGPSRPSLEYSKYKHLLNGNRGAVFGCNLELDESQLRLIGEKR